ncbi:hypothetical protein BOX15_Mlig012089g1 [Macrostomum lignano]|uniref:Uncharacterized protein n=1 Tax=Macrostomum lignano TaxID=282301 RepID=A0A267FHL8_9PLAT|nr:hypothetical protein BOX15_Mlig012089g1 [Macrostomum lignano]
MQHKLPASHTSAAFDASDVLPVLHNLGTDLESLLCNHGFLNENEFISLATDADVVVDDEAIKRGWVSITEYNLHQLKPADVLEIRYNGMPRTILIERVTTTADKTVATAFHYGWHRAVKTVVREEFLLSGRRYCRLLLFSKSCCYPPEVVLQRAESRLNDRNYGRMASNSGQFARWCKTINSTHLDTVLVPIYLSDQHPIHQVKENDHMNLKFGWSTIHGEVKKVTDLDDTGHLLTVLVAEEDWKNSKFQSINKSGEELKADTALKTRRSQLPQTYQARLAEKANVIKDLAFRSPKSSKDVAQIVVSCSQSEDETYWLQSLLNGRASPTSNRIEQVKARDLRPGDIICSGKTHRAVLRVQLGSSSQQIKLETLQYSIDDAENVSEHREIKYVIGNRESEAQLVVHNDVKENCSLYGGGSKRPIDTRTRVKKPSCLKRGSIVSFKKEKDSGMYTRAAILENPKVISEATGEYELDLAMYEYTEFRVNPCENSHEIIERSVSFKVEDELFEVDYKVPAEIHFSPDQVVARAKSRIGERQFDLQWNSSRDFARWCSIRHASNREQCCVPIESAAQLLEFGKCHIKYQKFARFYTHDAILRDIQKVSGCSDIVRVRIYENNAPYRKVRMEPLDFSSTDIIRRVQHPSLDVEPSASRLDEIQDCTFLNSDDDFKGSVGKGGSKVTDKDFCFGLKMVWSCEGLRGVQSLFGTELTKIKDSCESLQFEDGVTKSDLRRWDHIVLKRRVHGVEKDVHFVITDWDSAQCSRQGVTYEFGAEREDKGFKEFRGFLRIATANSIEKVVHNCEPDWEKIDSRFREFQGFESYDLFNNN